MSSDYPAELDQKIVLGNTNTGGRSGASYDPEKGRADFAKEEQEKFDTLTEPVWETIKRDLSMIWVKLTYVMVPRTMIREKAKQLRDWDLWGPLVLCLALSLCLSFSANTDDGSLVFEIVFVIVWAGAAIVAVNGQLLGGNISFFQSVCVLGYCLFPLTLAAFINMMFLQFFPFIIRIIPVGVAFIWSSYSSVGFIAEMVVPEKKGLAAFPVFLFYLFLSWFILL